MTQLQPSLSGLSRSSPRHPFLSPTLARKLLSRHKTSTQKGEIDQTISFLTELILFYPLLTKPPHSITLQAFYHLANALIMRSKSSNQPEDAISAVKYLSHLRDQPREISNPQRHQFTTSLVNALAVQVELEAGDVKENIRQMVILCHEYVTSGLNTSDHDATHLIRLISGIVVPKIHMLDPDQPLDKVIECLQAARKHRPDLFEARIALARSFSLRYCMTLANDDYEEAMSILDEIITSSSSPGDSRTLAKGLAARLADSQLAAHHTPEYLEEAIYRAHASLGSTSIEDTYDIRLLEKNAKHRITYFGSIEGVEASSGVSSSSQQAPRMTKDENNEPDRTHEKMESLLFGIRNNSDMTKIDETIEKGRIILSSYDPTDLVDLYPVTVLGDMLEEAFERTHKIEYLNESISVRRHVAELSHLPHLFVFPSLSSSLLTRFRYFPGHRTHDLDEALELHSKCLSDPRGYLPERFLHACAWASLARENRHPSTTTAYETALSLMRDTLHFSPTLQLQHATLATHDAQ